jgi:hypothetical protein
MRDILLKNTADGTPTDWLGRLSGKQEWEASHEGLVLNGSDEYHIANGNAKLEIKADPDGSGTKEYMEIPRLTSIDFTLSQEVAETGGLDRPLWRYIRPAEREFEISLSGSYLDPAADLGSVYKALNTARNGSNRLPARLTVYGKTFEGDVAIGPTEYSASTGGEDAEIDVTLMSDEELVVSGDAFGTGVENIFTAFMNKSKVDVGMLKYDGGSVQSGATKMTGSGYFTSVDISISDGEEITCSTSVAGDGPISYSQQS